MKLEQLLLPRQLWADGIPATAHGRHIGSNEMQAGICVNRGPTVTPLLMAGKTIDLFELFKNNPDIMIVVGGSELSLYNRKLIAEARLEFERELALKETEKAETYVTAETVKAKFDISDSTLYRLSKKHVLEPVYIGGQRRYRLSDLDRLISNAINK